MAKAKKARTVKAAKKAVKKTTAPATLVPLPIDRPARAAIKAVAAALASMTGFPSEEQALVDAAKAAADQLE